MKLATILPIAFILYVPSVLAQTVVFRSFDNAGPFSAFPAAAGVIGVEDYVMEGPSPGLTSVALTSFRFVGGVTSSDGNGGWVNFDWADAGAASQINFDVSLPADGNFIWTVGAAAGLIPTTGLLTITVDQADAGNVGRDVLGQWWIVPEGFGPPVGTSPLNPSGLPVIDDTTSVFTLEITTDTNLPVEFSSFEGIASGRDVNLEWKTASEDNNAGFYVEQKMAEGVFIELGFVEGAGSTTDEQTYEFTVRDLTYGPHAFRIRQVDFDGASSYSPEVEVRISLPVAFEIGAPYPNPTNRATSLDLAVSVQQQVKVALYDVRGQLIRNVYNGMVEAELSRKLRVDLEDLPAGTYILIAEGETFKENRKVVLVH